MGGRDARRGESKISGPLHVCQSVLTVFILKFIIYKYILENCQNEKITFDDKNHYLVYIF